MKKHLLRFIPLLCLLMLLGSTSVSAASLPGKVFGLTASTNDSVIKLKWKKASKAKKYAIYRVDASGSQAKLLKKTSSTSYSLKGSYGATYYFKVCALNSSGKSGEFSSVVSASPKPTAPSTPKNFTMKSRGNLSITLRWSRVSKSNGYVIEQYYADTNEWNTVKTISSSSTKEVTLRNLSANVSYQFRIRSFRKVNGTVLYSSPSQTETVSAVKYSSAVSEVRAPYYVGKAKSKITTRNTSTGATIVIHAGEKVTLKSKQGTYVNGYTKSKEPFRIKRSLIKYTGLDSRSSDYTTSVKEQFVNSKGLSSKSKYLIWVSQYTYRINIFKGSRGKWKLEKSYPCIVGSWNARTSPGIRRILKKQAHGQYGGPVITFTAGPTGTSSNPVGNAFHHYVDGSRTGAKSHGCVRVSISALNFIYRNCPVGTTVFVY